MKNKIKKEIKYWEDIEKQIDNCPKENYKEFTRLEQLWMNCPIYELIAQLKGYEQAEKEIIKNIKSELQNAEYTIENLEYMYNEDEEHERLHHFYQMEGRREQLKELLKSIGGGE